MVQVLESLKAAIDQWNSLHRATVFVDELVAPVVELVVSSNGGIVGVKGSQYLFDITADQVPHPKSIVSVVVTAQRVAIRDLSLFYVADRI